LERVGELIYLLNAEVSRGKFVRIFPEVPPRFFRDGVLKPPF